MQSAGWLPILLLFLLLTACEKDSSEPKFKLTAATQTGANTLSFRVDDRVWQPYGRRCFGLFGGPCIDEPLNVYYNSKRGQFQITCFLTTDARGEDISLECDSLFQSGLFVFPAKGPRYRQLGGGLRYSFYQKSVNMPYYTHDPMRTTIQITRLDTVARIVSGTFSGILQENITPPRNVKDIHITDGRFDVKY